MQTPPPAFLTAENGDGGEAEKGSLFQRLSSPSRFRGHAPHGASYRLRALRRTPRESSPAPQRAKELIEAGVKTKKGNNWSMTSVIRFLHNPIYIGKLTYKD